MQSRVMEKSKVLYNLDEILQNGYSIKQKYLKKQDVSIVIKF